MLRNLIIAWLLVLWFLAVVFCTLCRQWAIVACLFAVAWFVEQSVSYATDEE